MLKLSNLVSELAQVQNENLSMVDLVTIYNNVSEKSVKKFTNKTVAVERTIKALEVAIDEFPKEETSKEHKEAIKDQLKTKRSKTNIAKDKIAEVKAFLKEKLEGYVIRQWHFEGTDGKAIQNGEEKLGVANTFRDVIFIKNGRDLVKIVVISLEGLAYIDGKVLSNEDIVKAIPTIEK
ncbi:MAG: hypothetical protein KUG64_10735 [Cycloclasticus sp.]|nr:hypothetical protein [Cycloclasticus sp.]